MAIMTADLISSNPDDAEASVAGILVIGAYESIYIKGHAYLPLPLHLKSIFSFSLIPHLHAAMPSYTSFLSSAIVGVLVLSSSARAFSEQCNTFEYPLSCHNKSAVANTCCFNYPGGLLLQTQFWDSDPATGPADHWTVHGLW